jgi:hypothetical protein
MNSTSRTLVLLAVTTLVVGALHLFGLVTFRYERRIDNDPLRSPVRVVEVQGDRIRLADGRVVRGLGNMVQNEAKVREALRRPDNHMDLEGGPPPMVALFVKKPRSRCIVSGAVTIPLIPVEVPAYCSVQPKFSGRAASI